MFLESQSSKLKRATQELAGDPRFRLFSSLPKGGVTATLVILGLAALAALFMLVAQIVIDGRVAEGMRCGEMAAAALVASPVTEPAVLAATQCVEKVGSVDDRFDAAFRHMEEGFARVLSAVRDGRYEETKAGEGDVLAGLRELVLWLESNDDDFMRVANSAALARCGELATAAASGATPDVPKTLAGIDCLNLTGTVHSDLEPVAVQLRRGLVALRDAGQGDAQSAEMVERGASDVRAAVATLAAWRQAHEAELAQTKAARDKLTPARLAADTPAPTP